ncbi:MAG: PAS domain S-box protein, partial [Solirubrobacterales bacterium]
GELVFGDDGRPVRLVGTVQDVTERKRAEETLKASEARFKSIVTSSPSGIHLYELRKDGRLVFAGANPAAEEILGVSHAQLTGKTIEEAFPGLAQTEVPARYREVARCGTTWRTEQIAHEEDRVRGAFEVVAFQTDPGKMVALFNDITERKQAEVALRELGRKDEEALRVAEMGHWEFDVAGGTFLFNDQYYSLHGITAQQAGGYRMTPEEFARKYVHPDDAHLLQESIHQAVATDDPDFQYQTEARILRCDGQTRWVTVWFRVEKDAQGRTTKLHGVNQDITERRYAEEALRRLNERLETLVAQRTEALTHTVTRLQQLTWDLSQTEDRERKRIADILHDDVQQTLAAARFHLNLLSTGPRSPAESEDILRQVKQMLKEAIEKARSLSHELSPALYQVGLAETLKWLAQHMQDKHGLTTRVETQGPVESSSEPVKALLYKVTQELLFNVVKHAGIKEALIRVQRKRRFICLTVIDRGRGFKPQELEKTAGFGLLGIRERIQLLGGRMQIKSEPGKGCKLLIAVPDEGPAQTGVQAK